MVSKTKEKIKKALRKQLREKKATQAHYLDLIADYADMYDIKESLKKDIEERGVAVYWNNGGGQEGWKKNDSISELVRVNNQMLKILADLGLRGADIKVIEEEEEL